MDTVIIWHICDILWKFQPSSSIFRLWHLEAKILKWPENGQNPKGGPLDEKNIFSTTFLDLVENRLKWLEMLCWFQKHVDQYIFDIWCHRMTLAVIRCHVMLYDDIQCHKVHWYMFHPWVPPLDFDPFRVILRILSRDILDSILHNSSSPVVFSTFFSTLTMTFRMEIFEGFFGPACCLYWSKNILVLPHSVHLEVPAQLKF